MDDKVYKFCIDLFSLYNSIIYNQIKDYSKEILEGVIPLECKLNI